VSKNWLNAKQSVASFGRSIVMVGWSFLGIRKKSEFVKDVDRVNPLHVIVVGFLGAMILVIGLIALVNWVAAK